ncbi:MAG: hypothetical protein JNL11_07400 [Bdellovibrionaceae bacterium]|nr:hypothetical protein [Pseudobdellovibrionaceae bacterium]
MNLKWAQHFQNYLADFENKYKTAQTHLSPTGFALSQKIIPMNEYLKWAQTAYYLPVIQDEYFNAHLPSIDDWKAWKSEFPWSEEIVPIGLWDGHLLVACLEIPARFPASMYPIFLLAEFKHTQRTYQFYINSDKGTESAKKIKELVASQPQMVNYTNTASAHKTTQKNDLEVIELAETPETDHEESLLSLQIADEQPEGLNLSLEPEPPLASKSAPLQNEISFDALDALSTPPREEISLKFTNVEVNTGNNASGFASLSKSGTDNTTNTGFTNTGMTSTKLGLTSLATVASNLPTTIQKEMNQGLPYFIAIKKDNPTNFENITQSFFSKASNLFDKFIIIAVDSSELNAVPVSWSDNVTPRSKDLEKLDLSQPSIFKTVATTLKSYHGYIVLNECNEKFFEFWNQGQVPGNVTMVPLIVSNKLVGMWMGLGESNTYNWNTLKQMESKGKELCESFANLYKDGASDAA